MDLRIKPKEAVGRLTLVIEDGITVKKLIEQNRNCADPDQYLQYKKNAQDWLDTTLDVLEEIYASVADYDDIRTMNPNSYYSPGWNHEMLALANNISIRLDKLRDMRTAIQEKLKSWHEYPFVREVIGGAIVLIIQWLIGL